MAWFGSRVPGPKNTPPGCRPAPPRAPAAALTLLAALLLLSLSGCLTSTGDPTPPEMTQETLTFTGDAWAVYRVIIGPNETAQFSVDLQRDGSSLAAFGIWTLHARSLHLDSLFVASTMSHRDAHHVQLIEKQATLVTHQEGTQSGTWGGMAEIRPHNEMDLYVVMLAGADGPRAIDGTFRFQGTQNATLIEHQQGAARLATERDFTGIVNVIHEGELHGNHLHTKIIQDAKLQVPTEHRLFGAFKGDVRTGSLDMAVAQERSPPTPCKEDHAFPYTCFLSGHTPGNHELWITENIDTWEENPDCDLIQGELPGNLFPLRHRPLSGLSCNPPPVVWALVGDIPLPAA